MRYAGWNKIDIPGAHGDFPSRRGNARLAPRDEIQSGKGRADVLSQPFAVGIDVSAAQDFQAERVHAPLKK